MHIDFISSNTSKEIRVHPRRADANTNSLPKRNWKVGKPKSRVEKTTDAQRKYDTQTTKKNQKVINWYVFRSSGPTEWYVHVQLWGWVNK